MHLLCLRNSQAGCCALAWRGRASSGDWGAGGGPVQGAGGGQEGGPTLGGGLKCGHGSGPISGEKWAGWGGEVRGQQT